jgi:hypothetical protein
MDLRAWMLSFFYIYRLDRTSSYHPRPLTDCENSQDEEIRELINPSQTEARRRQETLHLFADACHSSGPANGADLEDRRRLQR